MPDPAAPIFDSMHILATDRPHESSASSHEVTLADSRPYNTLSTSSSSDDLRNPRHSTAAASKKSRRSLASLAREKTSNVLTGLASISTTSNHSLRSAPSTGSLSKESQNSNLAHRQRPALTKTAASGSDIPTQTSNKRASRQLGDLANRTTPPPAAASRRATGKMHQTSSKILRMTDDDRPFTKDFNDLFATLVASLPLTPHRYKFSRAEESFTSEEAITNLGSLKFTQSNRVPDPKNPSRWVVTTTTTTFSMAKEMARSVCQRFLDARLIEVPDGKYVETFALKGGVWQPTPKGIHILHRFCVRNGIAARHLEPLFRRDQMQLVSLERDDETDKLSQDKGTIEVIFRRFAGQEGPNVKTTTSISDNDSLSDYSTGQVGVKVASQRKIFNKTVPNTFTGKAASDWLLDCCTTVDRRETFEIAEMFVKWQLMLPLVEDKAYVSQNPMASVFQPTKEAIYSFTEKGQQLCGWLARDPSISSTDSRETGKERTRPPKDSNTNRLTTILLDPALRLLFREFLRLSLCEENLSFYLDVKNFTSNYQQLEITGRLDRQESVRDTLAAAYGLSFFAYRFAFR
jgi:GTPase-activating protein SST2